MSHNIHLRSEGGIHRNSFPNLQNLIIFRCFDKVVQYRYFDMILEFHTILLDIPPCNHINNCLLCFLQLLSSHMVSILDQLCMSWGQSNQLQSNLACIDKNNFHQSQFQLCYLSLLHKECQFVCTIQFHNVNQTNLLDMSKGNYCQLNILLQFHHLGKDFHLIHLCIEFQFNSLHLRSQLYMNTHSHYLQ